jgi:hypothetical protein
MELRRRHWWNGKWGRLARRDVLLYLDDVTQKWTVEAREGGVEGDSRWWELNSEADALRLIEGLTEPTVVDAWRELPVGKV